MIERVHVRAAILFLLGVPFAAFLIVAAFPWGLVARSGLDLLAGAIGRPVTVGAARRLDWFGLVPTIALDDVTIGQPAWQGRGTMARIAHVRLTLPVLPLLTGRFHPHRIDLDGVRLALFRAADGRANWNGDGQGGPPQGTRLTIRDGRYRLRDLGRQVLLAGTLVSDATHGLVIDGSGTLRGRPLRVAATGGARGAADPTRPYPLRVVARSPLVAMAAQAILARPLDLRHFTARVVASGRDLTHLDDLVQAGLFPSQAFRLAGAVTRDGPRWRIAGLNGAVGRTTVTATVTVVRADGRTRVDGRVDAGAFDFADFVSDAQRARADARLAAVGPRLLPETSIDLEKMARLDGVLRFRAAHLLTGALSPFRSLATTVTLDHRRLALDPLDAGLVAGRMTGRVTVDDTDALPRLGIDTRIGGSTIQALLLKRGSIRGPLDATIHLAGRGATFRAAMGASSGRIGIWVQGGTMRRDYATFVGGDVVRSAGAVIGGGGARVALRCLVGVLEAHDGRLVPAPLTIDSVVSRAAASGSIDLSNERLDLTFTGRSKQPALFRSTTPTRLFGTFLHPQVDIRPPRAKDRAGSGLLDRVGTFVNGLRIRSDRPGDAPAPDADCGALAHAAMR